MITIGVYPRTFHGHHYQSDLAATQAWLSSHFNSNVGVHILPFWRSEGDGGFALSSWSEVDPTLGSIDDVRAICRSYPVYIDGIYNHVGWSHPIAADFLANPPSHPSVVTAERGNDPPAMPNAPRGGSLYKTHVLQGDIWQIRQTFSERAVDINISDPRVLDEVFAHLGLLTTLGARGVRLDAVEYYGRQPTRDLMNNSDGIALATLIAQRASSLGLEILLQMDFDSRIAHYKDFEKNHPVIVDYSFPTYLVHAFMTGTTQRIVNHVINTLDFGEFRIQRPVRTHDGVLMRSVHQPPELLEEVVGLLRKRGCQLRYTNGTLYECNNSLPFLFSINDSVDAYYKKLASALILAELTADSSYVYAGCLLGDLPESDRSFSDEQFTQDPRMLQRRSVDHGRLTSSPWLGANEVTRLINILAERASAPRSTPLASDIEVDTRNGVIEVHRKSLGLHAALNFTNHTVPVNRPDSATLLRSAVTDSDQLGPFGWAIYEK